MQVARAEDRMNRSALVGVEKSVSAAKNPEISFVLVDREIDNEGKATMFADKMFDKSVENVGLNVNNKHVRPLFRESVPVQQVIHYYDMFEPLPQKSSYLRGWLTKEF